MKKQIHFATFILMLAGTMTAYAQEPIQTGAYTVTDTINGEIITQVYASKKEYDEAMQKKQEKIDALKEEKRNYESEMRDQLAEEIETINSREQKGENYTREEAQKDKELVAARYAEKIALHNAMIDAQIKFLEASDIASGKDRRKSKLAKKSDDKNGSRGRTSTTTEGFTIGFGYNYIDGDNLSIDDFSYANNNYFSVGFRWRTALDRGQNIRFLYGIEYQSQGTELNGNRAFTISDPNNTQIERLSFNGNKAKFRQDQLVFPLHFEIGGVKRKEYEDGRVSYDYDDQFKIGFGGYAGFNLSSRLKYKYDINGEEIKQITINAFDNNAFVYGLDAYIGYDHFTIFGRMGLNDIFQSGSVNGQYVAFGIRFQ